MTDTTQQAFAEWIPAKIMAAALFALVGVIWWTWRREQSRQIAAIDKLAIAVAELNIRLTGVVTVADYSRSIASIYDKINNQAERLAVIEDRERRS